MPVLDYHAFPHILDSIVKFAPAESLLALRAACRGLRDAADARLFEHVTVAKPSMSGTDVVIPIRPFGSTLTFEWLRLGTWPPGPDDAPPLTTPRCPVCWSKPPTVFHSLLGLEVEVDCPHTPPLAADTPPQARLRTYIQSRVQQARVIDNPSSAFGPTMSQTMCPEVDELEAYNASCEVEHTLRSVPGIRRDLFPKFSICTYTRGRSVGALYNLPGAAGVHTLLSDPTIWTNKADDIVIHLLGGKRSRPAFPWARVLMWKRSITVVGGAQKLRCDLKLAVDAGMEDLRDAIRQCIGPRFFVNANLNWLDSLRLLSPAEYAAEVGEAQVALETRQNPYSDPPAVYLP